LEHIKSNILYIEKQQSGLGSKFYSYLLKKVKILSTNPLLPIVFDNIRCVYLKKYNYRVHYVVDEQKKKVKILGVYHTSRDPKLCNK